MKDSDQSKDKLYLAYHLWTLVEICMVIVRGRSLMLLDQVFSQFSSFNVRFVINLSICPSNLKQKDKEKDR